MTQVAAHDRDTDFLVHFHQIVGKLVGLSSISCSHVGKSSVSARLSDKGSNLGYITHLLFGAIWQTEMNVCRTLSCAFPLPVTTGHTD